MNSEENFEKYSNQEFVNLFNDRENILKGNGIISKEEFLNRIETIYNSNRILDDSLLNCINIFYQENKGLINNQEIDPRLNSFLQQMDNDYKSIFENVNIQSLNEPIEKTVETQVNTNDQAKQRRLITKPKTGNHGLSTVAIVLEILTVAIIIMMFLSLDI